METQQDDFGLDFSVYQKKKRTKCYKWISISWAEKKKQVFHSNESYCRQTHYLHILIFILYFFSDVYKIVRSLSIKIYSKALMLGHLAMDIPEIIYILN